MRAEYIQELKRLWNLHGRSYRKYIVGYDKIVVEAKALGINRLQGTPTPTKVRKLAKFPILMIEDEAEVDKFIEDHTTGAILCMSRKIRYITNTAEYREAYTSAQKYKDVIRSVTCRKATYGLDPDYHRCGPERTRSTTKPSLGGE